MFLKLANERLSPVRIIVEDNHMTIRTHGASSAVNPALAEFVEGVKTQGLNVPSGVYRLAVKRYRVFQYEFELVPA